MTTLLETIVSIVPHARATCTRDIKVGKALQDIARGVYSKQVEAIRRTFAETCKIGGDGKGAVKPLKAQLPAFMWSGQFKSRRAPVESRIIQYSGLICADIDGLGVESQKVRLALTKCPQVFALFASPTGNGLKVLFRVPNDASIHPEAFHAVCDTVAKLGGCEVDQQCRDIPRLCYVSHDPDLYFNPSAKEVCCTHRTHSTQSTHIPHIPHNSYTVGERQKEPRVSAIANLSTVEKAIALALPTVRGASHKCIFKLAGALKAVAKTTKQEFQQLELRPIIHAWFLASQQNLDPNQTESDYYIEFLDAWNNASAMREGIVEEAWRLSEKDSRPPELTPDLDSQRLARFASFLRRLQILCGDRPFYLSPYKAAATMGHQHHSTACLWIGALRATKIISLVEKGVKRKSAASYRYNLQSHAIR